MIDYHKLKLALELAETVRSQQGFIEYDCDNIDDLIAKLYELTKRKLCKCRNILKPMRSVCDDCIDRAVLSVSPRHEYKVGQNVWFVRGQYTNFKAEMSLINCFVDNYINFCDKDGIVYYILQEHVYPSREELIEAQIEHWQKLIRDDDNFVHCMVCGQPSSQITKECGWKAQDMKNNSNFRAFKYEPNQECKHESDGTLHDLRDDVAWMNIVQKYKCSKCGDFYK